MNYVNRTTLATSRLEFVHEVHHGFVVDIDLSQPSGSRRVPRGDLSWAGSLAPEGVYGLVGKHVECRLRFECHVASLESAR